MREIKFRAWDNVKNKMYYTGDESEVVISFDSSGLIATDITEHDWGFKKLEHLKYTQYTGLKDRNGKEIYEGDIVKRPRDGYGVVEFHNSWGAFYCSTFLSLDEYGNLVKASSSVPFWNDSNKFEVVGNIFKNPELLTV